MSKFHDLTIERLSDGNIRLIQQDGVDDPSLIDLHPEQIKFIARQLCGMRPDAADAIRELERRLSVLTEKLQDLVCAEWLRGEILDRCGYGGEILSRLDGLLDLTLEMDGGQLRPQVLPDAQDEALRRESLPTDTSSPTHYSAPVGAPNGELFATNQLQGE